MKPERITETIDTTPYLMEFNIGMSITSSKEELLFFILLLYNMILIWLRTEF